MSLRAYDQKHLKPLLLLMRKRVQEFNLNFSLVTLMERIMLSHSEKLCYILNVNEPSTQILFV